MNKAILTQGLLLLYSGYKLEVLEQFNFETFPPALDG
jgi:hypothetical protein